MTHPPFLPTAQVPSSWNEILLMDKVRKGEITEHPDMERLKALIEHQDRGGTLVLTYVATPVCDNDAINKRMENKRKL